MDIVFYISAMIAIIATLLVITNRNAIHALLYLIVAQLSIALIFFTLGAPFVAALQVIVYAGAIMVLFIFAIMMLNLSKEKLEQEQWLYAKELWIGPGILSFILFLQWVFMLLGVEREHVGQGVVTVKEVTLALFGPYLIGVELASMLLLAGLIGAYHLGKRDHLSK